MCDGRGRARPEARRCVVVRTLPATCGRMPQVDCMCPAPSTPCRC
ncbi:hypothetical protein COLSTE_00081 [Collinsella stercoris DSM 13279]|uniref:Uncharacterized protein n=1 Tax=Collinsella stercoris DSM 13279 TaxID=445975 RepID=B6G7P1_9ACTN|nr:hypothetical protein COLSTE_00081 [Collinsella stercoris DSM 13279]